MPDEPEIIETPTGGDTPAEAVVTEPTEVAATPTEDVAPIVPPKEVKEPSYGVQKRIDELTSDKYDIKRERDYYRDLALRDKEPPAKEPGLPIPDIPRPNQDDYDDYESYQIALGEYGAQVAMAKAFAKARQDEERRQRDSYSADVRRWSEKGRDKYPDFLETVQRNNLNINQATVDFVMLSPYGHDIAYKLAQDNELSEKVYRMNTAQTVLELQKLEANFKTPQKAVTAAPVATSPVGGIETPAVSEEDMDYETFKKHRRRQEFGVEA